MFTIDNINPDDFEWQTIRSGTGGNDIQRVTHKATGMQAECDELRRGIENRFIALAKLIDALNNQSLSGNE